MLWAGTDDGALWVTRDGGKKWTNVADKVGLPGPRWVASIEPSRYVEGRAYVVFDAHRSDDDEPYVYVTEDFGETWKSLRGNLPTGSTRVLREDIEQSGPALPAAPSSRVWASINRGAIVDEDQQQPADGGGPRVRAATRRRARSWRRRTAAACGSWT